MSTIKIALVDDSFHTRRSVHELLGYCKEMEVVQVCDSGMGFLDYLKKTKDQSPPDIVLMDIDMPELDGIDTDRFL